MLTEEQLSILEQAANIMASGWSDDIAQQFYLAMAEIAKHGRLAGTGAREKWIKSLKSMSEIVVSIAKRES